MKFRFDDYNHNAGDVVEYKKFLIIPRKCTDGWWRFLETVNVTKSYYYITHWYNEYDTINHDTKYSPLTHEQKFDKAFQDIMKK